MGITTALHRNVPVWLVETQGSPASGERERYAAGMSVGAVVVRRSVGKCFAVAGAVMGR